MPEISVIVPIYNVEKYLPACLNSLLAQSFQDFEAILVNDGSLDGCQTIIDEYCLKDSRFVSLVKENGGLSDARNAGIKIAQGKYIVCLDSDDTFREDGLELLIKKAKEEHSDYIVFDMDFIWENSDRRMRVKGCILEEVNKKNLLLSTPSACNKMIERSLFEKFDFPYGKRYEDLATTPVLLGYAKKVSYLSESLYFYLQREGSIIYTFNDKMNDIYTSLQRITDYYKKAGWFEEYRNELEFLHIEHILLHHCRRCLNVQGGKKEIRNAVEWMKNEYPNWKKNPYLKTLPRSNQALIELFSLKWFGLIQLVRKVKSV